MSLVCSAYCVISEEVGIFTMHKEFLCVEVPIWLVLLCLHK